MRVLKFKDYSRCEDLAHEFIEILSNPKILESNEDKEVAWKQILTKVFSDLGLNLTLITTFGAGIGAMFPFVDSLIKNGSLNIDVTQENILLLVVAAVTITYLEEKKNKTTSKNLSISDEEIKKDSQSLLEELKLRGIGNGIVKKVMFCFKSVVNIAKVLFKNLGNVITGFIDMFSYTTFLFPMMNAILFLVGKYDLNLDTLSGNFLSLGVGVLSLIAKNGIGYLVNKLGDRFKLKKEEIIRDLDIPTVKKYPHPDFMEIDTKKKKGRLIKGNAVKKV